jgi:serine/threonine protein kinase
LPLHILGKGSFGRVIRALRTKDRENVAIKFIKVSGSSLDEIYPFVESFFLEYTLQKKLLNKQNNHCICNLIGAYYTLDQDDKADELVLISEAGNCNLKEIISIRENYRSQNNKFLYETEETLPMIRGLIKGLRFLMENRVYHSDVKPHNIVVNLSKNNYQYLDFGSSMIIEEKEDEVPLTKYALGGTPAFDAPEKKNFWKNLDAAQRSTLLFDPFKADVWSLGWSLKPLILSNPKQDQKLKILFKMMLTLDWRKRSNAIELDEYMQKEFPSAAVEISPSERDFVKKIEKHYMETENIYDMEEKLRKATMIDERIEYLEDQLARRNRKIGSAENTEEDRSALAFLHHTLGKKIIYKSIIETEISVI